MAYLNNKKILSVVKVENVGELQGKSVGFSLQEQRVTADSGYAGLSYVEIEGLTGHVSVEDENGDAVTLHGLSVENNELTVVIETQASSDRLPYRICNLGNYSIEDNQITALRDFAFYYDANLTSVSFPLVTSIGNNTFNNCSANLTSVNFPVATSIGNATFTNCIKLTSASFPLVTSIGTGAFNGCGKLTSVNFPVATSIGNTAFSSCSNLTSVSFPLVTSIGPSAFSYCRKLTSVTLGANQVCTLSNVTAIPASSSHHVTIYVPADLISSYQTATNWSTLYNNGYIDFQAISGSTVSITTTVTNGSYSGSASMTAQTGTATVTLTANSGYDLPNSITVTGASYTYDSTTGVISLSNATANVTISATCTSQSTGYTVSINSYIDGTPDWTIYYSLDNGATWVQVTATGTLSTTATQIKFKAVCLGGTPVTASMVSDTLNMGYYGLDGTSAAEYVTDNYILSSNVTDIDISGADM